MTFAIKCKLIINPMQSVIIMFVGTVCIFAYLVRIFEIPYLRLTKDNTTFDSYFNAVWFTVVTLTTIGYGDVSPGTHPGKIVTILLGFWGAIFLALLVATVSNIFNLSHDQALALRHVRLTRHAAQAICTSIQYFRAKKNVHMLKMSHDHDHSHHHSNFLELIKKGAQGAASKEQEPPPDNGH